MQVNTLDMIHSMTIYKPSRALSIKELLEKSSSAVDADEYRDIPSDTYY